MRARCKITCLEELLQWQTYVSIGFVELGSGFNEMVFQAADVWLDVHVDVTIFPKESGHVDLQMFRIH